MASQPMRTIYHLAISLLLVGWVGLACASGPGAQTVKKPALHQAVEAPIGPVCRQDDKRPIFRVSAPGHAYVRGADAGAKVTLVEFSEFQCPFCAKASLTLIKLVNRYEGQLRWVFRQNPLGFHKNAMPAALAASAAGRQGRFWEMHDLLFENRKKLDEDSLFGYASALGLDMQRFEADFRSPELKKEIAADQAEAKQLGANGVPTFYVNGRELRGAQPYKKFEAAVEEALSHARQFPGAGQGLYEELVACGHTQALKRPIRANKAKRPTLDLEKVYPVNAGQAYWIGGKAAPVEIIVYSDFQCPFCSRMAQNLTKVLEHYGPKVRVVFKHFPLPFHKQAHLASQAALAAGSQGKFWAMHDAIFANHRVLNRDKLENLAQKLGLDMHMFMRDLEEGKHKAEVDADIAEGKQLGVRGTPSCFVNGYRMVGAQPFEKFKEAIDKILKAPPLPAEKPL